MKILDLVLKEKWYNMIESGIKHEEYREIKPYWEKRLTQKNTPDKDGFVAADFDFKEYTHVRFRKGYSKTSITYAITEITIGRGNTEWGAPADKDVFIIRLSDKQVKQQLNDAIQDIIKATGNALLNGGSTTYQEIAEKVTEAFKIIVQDNKVNFTLNVDENKEINLVPADTYTKTLLEKI